MKKIVAFHLDKALLFLFSLNLLDALFTIFWISIGMAEEANPLMEIVLSLGPAVFLSIKLTLVSLGSALLWRLKHKGFAIVSVLSLLIVYCMITCWHMYHWMVIDVHV